MKKKKVLLMAAVAALMLGSCTNDDEILQGGETGKAIEFRTVSEEKTTLRAAITDINNILSFTVTGYWTAAATSNASSDYLFNGFGITRGENDSWSYSPIMYWPTTGSVDFYAYSPASSQNVLSTAGLTDYKKTSATDTIVYTVPQVNERTLQEDFLVARATNKSSGAVPLNFQHALSRVKFYGKTINDDLDYLVDTIELVNLYETAYLDLAHASIPESGSFSYNGTPVQPWKGHAGIVNYTADMGETPIYITHEKYSSLLGETNAIMVMPQTTLAWNEKNYKVEKSGTPANEFAIKVAYKAYIDDIYYVGSATKSEVVYFPVEINSKPITFEIGRQYAFYLKFGEDAGAPITFDVEVQDWETEEVEI